MITEIDHLITDRITVPTVAAVYDEWKRRGLLLTSEEFLYTLPEEVQSVLIHSFVTHVHKEKGLAVDIIGDHSGVDTAKRRTLAMSADMLWAISLIVDDIEDGDITRGSLDTCWVKFGKEQTLQATVLAIKALAGYLVEKTGIPSIPLSYQAYLQVGLRSLGDHGRMDLETPIGEITRNYEERCDFHGTFPLTAMSVLVPRSETHFNLAIAGLRLFNQAGQLINDLKDFVGGDLYHRSFSDIRKGVPTVPLVIMYHSLDRLDQQHLLSVFGSGHITLDAIDVINRLVIRSDVVGKVLGRITDCYDQSMILLNRVIAPADLSWFEKWIDYKLSHLKGQIATYA